MADATPIEPRDPGAPIAPGEIDPELVKLSRPRTKIGVITAAGVVLLCGLFLHRLSADRRFAGADAKPAEVAAADVVAGKIALDRLVAVPGDPVMAHAIRVTTGGGSLGRRLVPMRGTADRLWIVAPGDGWGPPASVAYAGRLRTLDDLVFAEAARAWAAEHARPVFATAAAIRAGRDTGKVTTVAGDTVSVADADVIALDVRDPDAAAVTATFNERMPDATAWRAALTQAGLTPSDAGTPNEALGQIRFTVPAAVAAATRQLERASLWAARVEPITRHHQTTWGVIRRSSPAGLDVGDATLPDPQIELVGLYVARGIPADAYALVMGEVPEDYWYVMPITIALAAIGLVFAWALVRAVRRDVALLRSA